MLKQQPAINIQLSDRRRRKGACFTVYGEQLEAVLARLRRVCEQPTGGKPRRKERK